jgi:hypothetical protein
MFQMVSEKVTDFLFVTFPGTVGFLYYRNFQMTKYQIFILCLCVVTLTIGCNRGFERCSVEGKVTWQEKPLGEVDITLRPASGPGAGTSTKADGTFLIPKNEGVMPGKCEFYVSKTKTVTFKDSAGRSAEDERSVLPDKFQTPKMFELKSGKNQIDLNLDQWDE